MRKISLALVALFVVTGLNAQVSKSSSHGSSAARLNDFSTVFLQWNPGVLIYDVRNADNQVFNGFSVGYSRTFGISRKAPVFLETGLGIQYSSYKDDGSVGLTDEDGDWMGDYEVKWSLLSARLPINIGYAWSIPNSKVTLSPFAGLHFRVNLAGKQKEDFYPDAEYVTWFYDDPQEVAAYLEEEYSGDFNLFDKKDMGKDGVYKRLQIGWQIGLNARFSNFLVGFSYESDFTELAKKTKLGQANFTVGYCF